MTTPTDTPTSSPETAVPTFTFPPSRWQLEYRKPGKREPWRPVCTCGTREAAVETMFTMMKGNGGDWCIVEVPGLATPDPKTRKPR